MSDRQASVRASGAKAMAAYLLQEMSAGRLREGMKLPAERVLSEQFGASRGAVRRVLQDFKSRGLISQTVGSGTFVQAGAEVTLASAIAEIADAQPAVIETSPSELMEARLLIEPLMPLLIVRHATASDFSRMEECLTRAERAESLDDFEHWDAELHRAFAAATHNAFFAQILDLVNEVRDRGEWGRLKKRSMTPERRRSYELQHRELVSALRDRDADAASLAMQAHLKQIQDNLFGTWSGAERRS
ncbi:DNA-binding FadR family transcriptional regulator [Paraburkholderia sp. GAS199]|uniref:FadR/GntR family transcriptional regulator n=1 Tax=Paraburkholderia sp. GAS199 TaxID=3035126 RepID=UPI003D19BA11